MSGQIETTIPLTHLDAATRADAVRRIRREPDPEYLLAVLGLGGEPIRAARPPKGIERLGKPGPKAANGHFVKGGRTYCAQCTRRTRADGICRREACGGAR